MGIKGELPYPNPGRHFLGGFTRSTYLGYDCYSHGKMDALKVRAMLRRNKMPARISQDIRDIMPAEIFWPTSAHDEVHRLIDSLYLLEVPAVESIIAQFPDHEFGLGEFLNRARRWRVANVENRIASSRGEPSPLAKARSGLDHHMRTAKPRFPGLVAKSSVVRQIPVGDYEIVLSTIFFVDGTPALRADIFPLGLTYDKHLRLSRVYIDMLDNTYEVIEHFPGRYQGRGLDERFLQVFLQSDRPTKRRTKMDNPYIRAAIERQRAANRESKTARAARTARAAEELHQPTEEEKELYGALVPGAPQ